MDERQASARWDELYRSGRYAEDPPLPFVKKILSTLQACSLTSEYGLYVGCGNGRNYLPLANSLLRLYGVDISDVALRQLAQNEPAVADLLIHADFRKLHSPKKYHYVIAIQVFQHGFDADVAKYFANLRSMLQPGGLFFLRVNSTSTQIHRPHTIAEQNQFGGKTVIYKAGSKRGLPIHFYSREEILQLTRDDFEAINELREHFTQRTPPEKGSWAQWEGIWRRTTN